MRHFNFILYLYQLDYILHEVDQLLSRITNDFIKFHSNNDFRPKSNISFLVGEKEGATDSTVFRNNVVIVISPYKK